MFERYHGNREMNMALVAAVVGFDIYIYIVCVCVGRFRSSFYRDVISQMTPESHI